MVRRVLGGVIAIVILGACALPFAQEAYDRYVIWRQLDTRDRVAFHEWNGSARSFLAAMHDRCVLAYGPSASACANYRVASE